MLRRTRASKVVMNPYENKGLIDRFDSWGEKHVWKEAELLLSLRGKILDIACGTGQVMKRIAHSSDVYGCDFSEILLKRAEDNGVPKDRLKNCDARKLAYKDEEFDYAYTIGSLEHFKDIQLESLRECKRVAYFGSFHHIPVSTENKDVGWTTDGTQEYYHQSLEWWKNLFISAGMEVSILKSEWTGHITTGVWFVCRH